MNEKDTLYHLTKRQWINFNISYIISANFSQTTEHEHLMNIFAFIFLKIYKPCAVHTFIYKYRYRISMKLKKYYEEKGPKINWNKPFSIRLFSILFLCLTSADALLSTNSYVKATIKWAVEFNAKVSVNNLLKFISACFSLGDLCDYESTGFTPVLCLFLWPLSKR